MNSFSSVMAVLLCLGLAVFVIVFAVGLIKDLIKLVKSKKNKKSGGEKSD